MIHGLLETSVRVGSRISLINAGSGHILLAFATPKPPLMLRAARKADRGDGGAAETRAPAGFENMQSLRDPPA